MSVIWIIERDKPAAMGTALMGDFPVRSFASVPSFLRLSKIKQSARPSLIVVDSDDCGTSVTDFDELCRAQLGDVPRVYLSTMRTAAPANLHPGAVTFYLAKPIDSFDLSQFLRTLIPNSELRSEQITSGRLLYKDIVLDLNHFTCQIIPDGELGALTLKEMRLLKLLIERAGHCLTRAEIKAAIWSDVAVSPRTIDSHISRLRRHLDNAETSIESVYGGGYILR